MATAWPVAADRHVYVGNNATTVSLGSQPSLTVSADGLSVYATREDFRVFVFKRDVSTGVLTFVEQLLDVLSPEAVTVSPDGMHVYVGSLQVDGLVVYDRDAGTSKLTYVESQDLGGVFSVTSLAISPDGGHLYAGVVRNADDQLVVFSRNTATGQLTHVETLTDGMSGIDGLDFPGSVVVSPDGNHVYVGGAVDGAIAIFSRNATTGALTYLGMVGGVSVQAMALSADGAHLYIAGGNVSVFSRDGGTGALTFVEAEIVGGGAPSVAVSPDGTHVYAALASAGLLRMFERDPGTGALTFEENLVDMQNGVAGLDVPFSVTVSPDSRDVYVNAFEAIPRFRRVPFACAPTPAAGCFGPTQPEQGMLILADDPDDAKDKLDWRWLRGVAVTYADFGDPIAPVTDYALCVYDNSGGGTLVSELLAPAGAGCGRPANEGPGPCWKANSPTAPTRLAYKRKSRHPDGISPLRLVSGSAGKSTAKVKAKGGGVPMPALPLTAPVTVQLQNAAGKCWENVFSTPSVNDGTTFKAKAD
jgi:6-phosphogluconolactonase (cycloisomerase 2 family)